MTRHFRDIRSTFINRRDLLRAGGALGLLAAGSAFGASPVRTGHRVSFSSLKHELGSTHRLAPGYEATQLIAWGDGLDGKPAKSFPLSEQEQARAFGFNNDFLAYVPLDGSRQGVLGVNHEYPTARLMFPGFGDDTSAVAGMSAADTRAEMAAIGHSVIEVAEVGGTWRVVPDSRYARRFTPWTSISIDGPAAGHPRLRTKSDRQGKSVLGILGCCAGGKTPWGTVLIAEENFGDFFSGEPDAFAETDPWLARTALEFGVHEEYRHWSRAESRFNLMQEPNEINRFGWIVEYDPRRPDQPPVKRTALGRFEHESALVVAIPGRPLVVYSGDDDENQFVYRFVSDAVYEPGEPASQRNLLSSGTLSVARFDDNGRGEWLALQPGNGPLTPESGYDTLADILIDCRGAGRLLGATPMDRPEGIAMDASTGRIYVALTKNDEKFAENAANPGEVNLAGHILELLPPGEDGKRDHTGNRFSWDILACGGEPSRAQPGCPRPAAGDASSWFCNPDNLTFDPQGRLWVATDGCNDFGFDDGLWWLETLGPHRGESRQLFGCPRGAELCGPEFTPDGRTLFVAVQHPAKEDGSSFDNPSTRWPDFNPELPPRSAVLAIRRSDGGVIGG